MNVGDMSWLGASGGAGMSLPQEFDTELQKMVTDEKVRSEQHKINYQQLKAEHSKLQDEYLNIQEDLKTTVEESRLVQERYRTLVDEGKRALMEKHAELEDVRTQVITPQKLDHIRHQMSEEIERPYKERYLKLERTLEEVTTNYNKLRYDISFVTSEYENEKTEHQQIISEMKMQYEAEVSNLRKEREAVLVKMQTETANDAQRVRALQRENTQLSVKNKNLTSEVEEVRALREKAAFDMDQLTRSHDKQSTEQSGSIKALEAEKESLRRQIDLLQKEFTSTGTTHEKLTNQIHELETENGSLRNRADELTHKNKVDLSNLRMEMLKQRGETERQRDLMANKLEDTETQLEIAKHKATKQELILQKEKGVYTETQLEIAKHKATKQEHILQEKEKECVRRMQAVREEEWAKNAAIENEKLELETKIQEMTRSRLDDETLKQTVRDRYEERLTAANEAKETAEREALVVKYEERLTAANEAKETAEGEALVVRTQLQNQERAQSDLEDERATVSRLKARLEEMEGGVAAARQTEHEMVDVMTRLKNQNQQLMEESRVSRHQLSQLNESANHLSSHQRAALVSEHSQKEAHMKEVNSELQECKRKLSSVVKTHKKYLQHGVKDAHMKEVNSELAECKRKLSSVVKTHKKFKSKCQNVVHNYKNKVQLQRARIEQLKIEKMAVQNYVSPEVFQKVQRQLKELQKRHSEFRGIIYSGAHQSVPIGNMNFSRIVHTGPTANSTGQPVQGHSNTSLLEHQHEADIEQLKHRLTKLDKFQQQQLTQLQSFTNSGINTDRTFMTERNCGNNAKIRPYSQYKMDEMSPILADGRFGVNYAQIELSVPENCYEKGDDEKSLKSDSDISLKDDLCFSEKSKDENLSNFQQESPTSIVVKSDVKIPSEKISSSDKISSDKISSSDKILLSDKVSDKENENLSSAKCDKVDGSKSEKSPIEVEKLSVDLAAVTITKKVDDSEKAAKGDKSVVDKQEEQKSETFAQDEKISSEIEEDISIKSGDEYSLKFDESISDEDKW